MEQHTTQRPEDFSLWFLLAETQGQAGNISKVHQARAEYFVLVGDFRRAREQLQYALRIESEKSGNGAVVALIRQRIKDIQDLETELIG